MLTCTPLTPRKIPVHLLVLLGFLAWATPATAGVGRWTALGPLTGSIRSLELDPHGTGRLLAVEERIGLIVSTDDGESWMRLSSRPDQTVSFDPSDPDVLYTPSTQGWEVAHVSRNGGVSWTRLGAQGYPRFVHRIVVDPVDPSVLYALADLAGFYRSNNGGQTWTPSNEGLEGHLTPLALWIDPSEPSTFYLHTSQIVVDGPPRAKGGLYSSTVYRSTDGGKSWTRAAEGLPEGFVTATAFVPGDPSTLYAMVDDVHLLRSTDGAGHWTAVSDVPVFMPRRLAALTVDPRTPTTLYAAYRESGVYRSQDGGTSWQDLGADFRNVRLGHLTTTAAPGVLLVGTESSGFLRSIDDGAIWSASNQGLAPLSVWDLEVDPSSPATLYAISANSSGVHRSQDGGRSWELTGQLVLSPLALAIDPLQPSTLYAGGDGIYRSDDQGDTWSQVAGNTNDLPVLALAVDPKVPRIIYAGTLGLGVMRSLDRGRSWDLLEGPPSSELYRVWALAIHPEDPRFVYAGTADGHVFRSADKGESWTRIDEGLPKKRQLWALAAGPGDAVYVTFKGSEGPFRSLDRGKTWSAPLGSLRNVRALQVDPLSPDVYASGGYGSVFRSRDQGRSWQALTDRGHPSAVPQDLKIVPRAGETPILYSATSQGIYELRPVERETVLAFQDGRFLVEVAWRDFRNRTGEGTVAVVPADEPVEVELTSPDSAVLEFFSGDNWEMLVKVLDGRRVNGNYWVFAAAATNVAYTVEVTDTSCGTTKTYRNALGESAPALTDDEAFIPCAEPEPPDCTPAAGVLCLGEGGRFRVAVTWRDFRDRTGVGRQVRIPEAGAARSDDSGLFYFFSEDNWEMLVKVLDGCRVNDHYWVFSAATTTVEYTLKVTDTASGLTKTYSNPLGSAAAATTDDEAFATCAFPTSD